MGHQFELAQVEPQQVAREQLGPRAHLERDAGRTEERTQLRGAGVQGRQVHDTGVGGGPTRRVPTARMVLRTV